MAFSRLIRKLAVVVGKSIVVLTVVMLVIVGLGLAVLETGWAKSQLRRLIVRQANQYLTATLEIGRLEGSLVRGLQLGDIRLSQNGRTLVAIDDVSLSYSLRELFQHGVVIKRVRLARPRIVMARTPGGRWDLAAIVKREARQEERTGPGRPITIDALEIYDGTVTLGDPLDFGAVHAPTLYESLNVTGAFSYEPVTWRLTFEHVSWRGSRPTLTVNHLSGGIENGSGGTSFKALLVQTPRTTFTMAGRIDRGAAPTALDLRVRADRFAFQEWSGVLHGLRNIAVDAAFNTALKGPLGKLGTELDLESTAGSIAGSLVLDTTVPGWRGVGRVDVVRLDLAGWLNRRDRPSNITGRLAFNLALGLGRHFPRGSYEFNGAHAEFMQYASDEVRARGIVTASEVQIAEATGQAYGAGVEAVGSSIGINEPFPFHFQGTMSALDLRRVPESIPVPHVESVLAFDYDVSGQFSDPFINGRARFARSNFVGATVESGTSGTIDTSTRPVRYTGEGEVRQLDLHRLGVNLDVGWLQDPRYAGTVSGRFRVSGAGLDRESIVLSASGRFERADLFHGALSDANVTLEIADGTLRTSYDGRFTTIDPSIPLANPRLAGSITGSADVRATIRDLLRRTPGSSDYDLDGSVDLQSSTAAGIQFERLQVQGRVHDGIAQVVRAEARGPTFEGRGEGSLAFAPGQPSDFRYEFTRLDLAQLKSLTRFDATGRAAVAGRASGPWEALHLDGDLTIGQFASAGVEALTTTVKYDLTIPSGQTDRAEARVEGHASFLSVLGLHVETASGTATLGERRLGFDMQLTRSGGRAARIAGGVLLHPGERMMEVDDLNVTLDHAPWQLARGSVPATISWTEDGLTVSPVRFVAAAGADQQIDLSGTWRRDGHGAFQVTATHVFLETLQGAFQQPARYGGVIDLTATIGGTRQAPTFSGRVTISQGRIQRFSYEKLDGHVTFSNNMFEIDARLDQAPGVWLTAAGSLPLGLFNRSLPDQRVDVAIESSPIGLGLLEGLTDVVRSVSGEARLDVKVVGTSHEPHFQGNVSISNAAFLVASTGVRYKNGRVACSLEADHIAIQALHVEDRNGRPLDVHGSLATRALRVADLEADATAKNFEVIHNELGRLDVDAALRVRGRLDAPQITGRLTISGGELHVDTILDRVLFRPYATEPASAAQADAVAALNPWDRLMINVILDVPETLKLTGEDLQVSPGTPVGLGDINLRVGGDLSLYKDPVQPLLVNGSLDSIRGTYAFQGRRFDVEQTSSINFHGDLTPDIDVSVSRLISGVLTHVTVTGALNNPELHLSSTPPLEPSDILSMIVFNAPLNDLSTAEQAQLAVRAGTIAAGFLAEPLVSAIEGTLGLETLNVEPGDYGGGAKLTIGEEIAPGLVARFSRQFGQEPYDQALIEYSLARLFRIRATFSDAATLIARAPFRRVERAGIDLVFFFSF